MTSAKQTATRTLSAKKTVLETCLTVETAVLATLNASLAVLVMKAIPVAPVSFQKKMKTSRTATKKLSEFTRKKILFQKKNHKRTKSLFFKYFAAMDLLIKNYDEI